MTTIAQNLNVSRVINDHRIDLFARFGYFARAVVYGLIGIFALIFVIGQKGALTDSHGALRRLLSQPFGSAILIAIAIGLVGYSLWRILQAVFDYDGRGSSPKGLMFRFGYILGGVTHALLAYYAFNLVFRLSKETSGAGERQMAHWLLTQPFGELLAGAVALIVIGFGIGQFYTALKERFTRGLDIPADKRVWLCRLCKFGIMSRGVIFGIVGWFFLRAAINANSGEAKGVVGVWRFLATQNYGIVMVGIIALGTIAFAIYGFTEAKYRHLR